MGHKISKHKIVKDAEAFSTSQVIYNFKGLIGFIRHLPIYYLQSSPENDIVREDTVQEQIPDSNITRIVHQSTTNIEHAYGPLVIGPVFGTISVPSSSVDNASPPFTDQALKNRKTDYQQHLQNCLESPTVIDDSEIQKIAEKIEDEKLNLLCQMLNIKKDNLDDWLDHPHENLSTAYRMIYFWAQIHHEQATVQQLAKVFSDCGQEEAILALNP